MDYLSVIWMYALIVAGDEAVGEGERDLERVSEAGRGDEVS